MGLTHHSEWLLPVYGKAMTPPVFSAGASYEASSSHQLIHVVAGESALCFPTSGSPAISAPRLLSLGPSLALGILSLPSPFVPRLLALGTLSAIVLASFVFFFLSFFLLSLGRTEPLVTRSCPKGFCRFLTTTGDCALNGLPMRCWYFWP